MLKKIISGGQTGADFAGLLIAQERGILTGGWMPKNFKNHSGYHPDYAARFGIQEHSSPLYPPRTYLNAKESDGTIRFAVDFKTSGEICTLKAINQYGKEKIDVDVLNPIPHEEVVQWILDKNIEILNVAGNSEKTHRGMSLFVMGYLGKVFDLLGVQ